MGSRPPHTRQRILDAALELFSNRGYDPVTVAEIADAVGIKAPSLYKHFKGKRHLYGAILAEMDNRYKEHMASVRLDGQALDGRAAAKDAAYYTHIDEDELVRFGQRLFTYFLHDAYASKFRKMLTLTQYTNHELSRVFVQRFFESPLGYQEASFQMLARAGTLAPEDPWIMALHYYAPTFLLLSLCDRCPEMEQDAIQSQERHIRQFVRIYGKNINKGAHGDADCKKCGDA